MADTRQFSEALGVTHDALTAEGALDGFVGVDSRLYIDPFLLASVTHPELAESATTFRRHFTDLVKLLSASRYEGDAPFRGAVRRLIFKELPALSLGYSVGHTGGSGIGEKLATSIARTGVEIVRAGIDDPDIFQLIGLFEDGIGADRVSDMTGAIIAEGLLAFAARVAARLEIATRPARYRGREFALPADKKTGRPILLVPFEILRDLPVAESWSDIDVVCRENDELRRRLNALVGETWKHATTKIPKSALRRALLDNPEAIKDLLRQYRAKKAVPYDVARDPRGELTWRAVGQQAAASDPLSLKLVTRDVAGVKSVVVAIIGKFKTLVEENGVDAVFRNDAGDWRHERYAQLVFFSVADSYCEANDLDLSREPNAGVGPVDFKVSGGYRSRVLVEFKYSHNSHLRAGYDEQLPTYQRSERAHESIYLVLRTAETCTALDAILELRAKEVAGGRDAPDIVVVDVRPQPSASKRR